MDYEDQDVVVAVSADPEEWMPMVIFALKLKPRDFDGDYYTMVMTSAESIHMGTSLLQAATVVADMREELQGKTIEERREILILESQFVADDEDED